MWLWMPASAPLIPLVKDENAGLAMYEQAAREGHWESAMASAMIHIDTNPADATPWLEQVLRDGHGPLKDLAEYFQKSLGLGTPVDKPTAAQALIRAAEGGESTSMLLAAELYANGDPEANMVPNTTEAIKFFSYAVMMGRLPARFNLAILTLRLAQERPGEIPEHELCGTVYEHFSAVCTDMHPVFRLIFAHALRAYDLGDKFGALLRFLFLAEQGSQLAMVNAAEIFEKDTPQDEDIPVPPRNFFDKIEGFDGDGSRGL
mgnify:CR=1 FL=1